MTSRALDLIDSLPSRDEFLSSARFAEVARGHTVAANHAVCIALRGDAPPSASARPFGAGLLRAVGGFFAVDGPGRWLCLTRLERAIERGFQDGVYRLVAIDGVPFDARMLAPLRDLATDGWVGAWVRPAVRHHKPPSVFTGPDWCMAVMPAWARSAIRPRLPNVKTVTRRALTVPVRRIGRAG